MAANGDSVHTSEQRVWVITGIYLINIIDLAGNIVANAAI